MTFYSILEVVITIYATQRKSSLERWWLLKTVSFWINDISFHCSKICSDKWILLMLLPQRFIRSILQPFLVSLSVWERSLFFTNAHKGKKRWQQMWLLILSRVVYFSNSSSREDISFISGNAGDFIFYMQSKENLTTLNSILAKVL